MNITIPITGHVSAILEDAQIIATALLDFCDVFEQTPEFRKEHYDWSLVRLLLSLAADVAAVRSQSDSDAILSLLEDVCEVAA